MNIYLKLLKKYSSSQKDFEVVANHSLAVLEKALNIIRKKKLYQIDLDLVIAGCLLHDIGAFEFMRNFHLKQNDYIKHGIIGGTILRKEKLNKIALIAERHIGAGISKEEIIENNFPLPKRNFLPITLEQKLVCYADKFHSKSGKKDNLESIRKEMKGYGKEVFRRFIKLEKIFK